MASQLTTDRTQLAALGQKCDYKFSELSSLESLAIAELALTVATPGGVSTELDGADGEGDTLAMDLVTGLEAEEDLAGDGRGAGSSNANL